MQPRPSVIVFDVNETLSDMAPLAGRFADVGAPELLAKVWFASLLRDGFALAATGGKEAFSRLARGALRGVLAGAGLNRPADDAADHVLSGFADLSVHPDVPGGVRTGWINRQPAPYPDYFAAPDLQAAGLETLAGQIVMALVRADLGRWESMPAEIGRQQLQELTGRGAQLVEVLPAEEYEWAHLPGALSLPLKELDERWKQLDRSRPVIAYCFAADVAAT